MPRREHCRPVAVGTTAGQVEDFGSRAPRSEVLALRALKLGDLLVAVPAIRGIHRALPEHRLVLAVPGWLEPIVELIGGVDVLLPTPGLDDPLPIAPGRIDIAVNLHGNGPESRGIIEALGARRVVGHRNELRDGPEWEDGVLERYRWARLVTAHGMPADPEDVLLLPPAAPAVIAHATVVHVGAFYGSREWPVERFAAVASALDALGHRVVFTGSGAERARAEHAASLAGLPDSTVLAGTLALDEFAALIREARLVVSADTGAAHLASAYRTPSVVLFGPAPVEEWGPPADGPHVTLTDARVRRGDAFAAEPDPAILAVTVDDVLGAVARLESRVATG
ncbi:glycosyltransferase family 9 protein [Salinibacterium sp. SYSU T00001]|uniref:glycosyltransferase family 9 protein n=1 Tax=Homoserinimonas sedimenticola TaxID=2986805 RepID=UPI002235D37A|nr:glycosyltransferase family 9 protein [Salinibacterium sedimenticola]MCW4385591.1 glycosyltransferase family 9 protein [Salinibacterium sedimenticola]